MTAEQKELLSKARSSLAAAGLLRREGHHGFAASRAYYTMLYVAQALLLGKDLAFSKHAAVHAAFGAHFVKTGLVPAEFHRYLIRAMEVRHAADYAEPEAVSQAECDEQIARAQEFLDLARRHIGEP